MHIKLWVLLLTLFLALSSGCQFSVENIPVDAHEGIRLAALKAANTNIGLPYIYGGGDFIEPRHVKGIGGVDCSGLVVNCYAWASALYGYQLPFSDATVKMLHENYTTPISSPEPGDLIFMGEDKISHVAIFKEKADSFIYFIDAHSISESVVERHYMISDYHIKSYGRMLVLK